MNLIVTTAAGDFYSLDVSADIEVENVVALVSLESGVAGNLIQLAYNGVPMVDTKKTLAFYGVKNGDMLLMSATRPAALPAAPRPAPASAPNPFMAPPRPASGGQRPVPVIDWGAITVPTASSSTPPPVPVDEVKKIRDELLADPYQMSLLRERNPPLATALDSGNLEDFRKILETQQEEMRKKKAENNAVFTGDPYDPENQRKYLEMLQGKQIEENLNAAMEDHPESFGQVIMLYIDCELNGFKVKAFVDSGAQMTLISSACAERCNVSRLIDKRFSGVAKGVGTQKILGRVHLLPLKIGHDHFPCTFSVLEHQPMDMLLGLDMLKRHQCVIDLKENCLKIGTTATQALFLSEKDIPKAKEDAPFANSEGPSGSAAGSAPATPMEVPDDAISKLMGMGFTSEQSSKALQMCAGNVEHAASLLFERGGQL